MGRGQGNGKGKYVVWKPNMDRVLTDTLIEEVYKGNKAELGWKPSVWTTCINATHQKCGVHVTKGNIKGHLKTWDKNYKIITQLLNQSGFGWNDHRKMIDVEESVWNSYLAKHPEVDGYRYKVIENYNELSIIIGNNYAKGDNSKTGNELELELDASNNVEDEINLDTDGVEGIGEGEEANDEMNSHQRGARASSSSVSRQPTRKKLRSGDALAHAVTTMSETLKAMLDSRLPVVDIDKLWKEIENIPNLDDSMRYQAIDVLASDNTKAHIFFGLPENNKMGWLMRHLKS